MYKIFKKIYQCLKGIVNFLVIQKIWLFGKMVYEILKAVYRYFKRSIILFLKRSNEYHGAVTAIATVALASLTLCYVLKTADLVNKQEEQFDTINRPKVWFSDLAGGLQHGVLTFINAGNLPAENLKIIWKIIKVEGEKIISIYPTARSGNNIVSEKAKEISYKLNLDQMQKENLSFLSEYKNDDKVIFLIVAWKYRGRGLPEYKHDSISFIWNNMPEAAPNRYWGNATFIGDDHKKAIDDIILKMKSSLDQ